VLQDVHQPPGAPGPFSGELHDYLLHPGSQPLEVGDLGGQHREAGDEDGGHGGGVAAVDVPPVLADQRNDPCPACTDSGLRSQKLETWLQFRQQSGEGVGWLCAAPSAVIQAS